MENKIESIKEDISFKEMKKGIDAIMNKINADFRLDYVEYNEGSVLNLIKGL